MEQRLEALLALWRELLTTLSGSAAPAFLCCHAELMRAYYASHANPIEFTKKPAGCSTVWRACSGYAKAAESDERGM